MDAGPAPPKPLITPARAALALGALAVLVWLGSALLARLDVQRRASAVATTLAGHPVKVNCPGLIRSVLVYESNSGWVEFANDGTLPDETRLTAEVCAGLRRLLEGGAALDLACLDNDSCPEEDRRLAFAVTVLSHESGHLAGLTDETATECFAREHSGAAAVALGASPAAAEQIARWQATFGDALLPERYRGAC